jgi:hypothetical protein
MPVHVEVVLRGKNKTNSLIFHIDSVNDMIQQLYKLFYSSLTVVKQIIFYHSTIGLVHVFVRNVKISKSIRMYMYII